MVKSTRFLNLISLDEALLILKNSFSYNCNIKTVPVSECNGYTTAKPVFAEESIPSFHLAAMDGIAVNSNDTTSASEQNPITVQGIRINTGNIVPDLHDAIIMIEDAEESEDGWIIRKPAHPWQCIRPVGEDIAATEMIIPEHHKIKPEDVAALCAYGVSEVPVKSLRVALIPTGSEIVPIGTKPLPGQVIESNMQLATALLKSMKITVTNYPIVADDRILIENALKLAVKDNDIIIISAGSSKGTRDYTSSVIENLGEVLVHGIAIKPAKPVIIGKIMNKPVIGIPGYPVACHTILREIITPIIHSFGFPVPETWSVTARLAIDLTKEVGTDEFVLTCTGHIRDEYVTTPLSRGSGIMMSMVRSNGYLKIPKNSEGFEAGKHVEVTLTVPKSIADETLLITGSHDPVIDYLATLASPYGIRICSSHVGSMGGLMALKRGFCHLAPTHLLAENGEYNVPYLQKYFAGEEMVLITVAEREQGIVSQNNLNFEDILQKKFINRQRGSGTRVLFDKKLKDMGIEPSTISGYDHEATTHSAVCLAVKSGEADLGMAVYSSAKAFGLDFSPVGVERYELATTKTIFETDRRVRNIAKIIGTDEFKAVLINLGGYRVNDTGSVRYI